MKKSPPRSGAPPSQRSKIPLRNSLPIRRFASERDWAAWLDRNHDRSRGLWLQIAKKGADVRSVSYAEALDVALCYGWIDGRVFGRASTARKRSRSSRRAECDRGMAQIERAKADGRWKGAYDSARASKVPEDLERALKRNTKARRFFETLDRANRYAILFRLQTARKAETRARRLADFMEMLERGGRIHELPRKR